MVWILHSSSHSGIWTRLSADRTGEPEILEGSNSVIVPSVTDVVNVSVQADRQSGKLEARTRSAHMEVGEDVHQEFSVYHYHPHQ
jgi:hypothetical protein